MRMLCSRSVDALSNGHTERRAEKEKRRKKVRERERERENLDTVYKLKS